MVPPIKEIVHVKIAPGPSSFPEWTFLRGHKNKILRVLDDMHLLKINPPEKIHDIRQVKKVGLFLALKTQRECADKCNRKIFRYEIRISYGRDHQYTTNKFNDRKSAITLKLNDLLHI